jgi:hypothetical protein
VGRTHLQKTCGTCFVLGGARLSALFPQGQIPSQCTVICRKQDGIPVNCGS